MVDTPTLARVMSVRTSNGIVYVDVEYGRPGVNDRGLPFASFAPGIMVTPTEGDYVEVYQTDDGKQARFNHTEPEYSMPDLPGESFVHRFNDDTEISVIKDPDGTYTVTVSGDSEVTLKSNGGTVNIEAGSSGTINLGQGNKQLITDIETTKDAEGHITDITLVKSSKINIE